MDRILSRCSFGVIVMAAAVMGCSKDQPMSGGMKPSPIVGTWQGRDADAPVPATTQPQGFQFASVSFVYDGTFTAQMRYNGRTVADSGKYELNGNTLVVHGSHGPRGGAPQPRTYTVKAAGNELHITDPTTNVTVTLDRMKDPAKAPPTPRG